MTAKFCQAPNHATWSTPPGRQSQSQQQEHSSFCQNWLQQRGGDYELKPTSLYGTDGGDMAYPLQQLQSNIAEAELEEVAATSATLILI